MTPRTPSLIGLLLLHSAITTAVAQKAPKAEFTAADPSYVWSFPRDHGSHGNYKTEWWYLTGHLQAADGRRFGYQLTFFRVGVQRGPVRKTRWEVRDVFPAHFAITDISGRRFLFAEKVNRGAPGVADALEEDLHVKNEGWEFRRTGSSYRARARTEAAELDLELTSGKELVLHGDRGYSLKGTNPPRASMYYSLTRMAATGKLRIGATWLDVSGSGWLDHEFGSNQLSPEQIGWDWFSIQLDSGEDLMIYRIRRTDGQVEPMSSGTFVPSGARAGRTRQLAASDFQVNPTRYWTSPKTGTVYPIDWTVAIPSLGAVLKLSAELPDQELVTLRSTGIAYWEGAVHVTGTWGNRPVGGRGYVELTGYQFRFRPKL